MIGRALKINRVYEGRPCNWCGYELKFGDDGMLCESCNFPHHARCWEEHDGCGTRGCVNEPFKKVDAPIAAFSQQAQLNADERLCPNCGNVTYAGDETCRHCRLSPGGVTQPWQKTTAPEAKKALTYAIIGLFCFGIILGPVAIAKANEAKAVIDANPNLGGRGLATAAQILGAIEILLFIVNILALLGRAM
jgi:Prokaryotic RING finger family 1